MENEVSLDGNNLESIEEKHRKEKREVQSKIQSMKKSVPKGDKKKNREIKAQICLLENQLSERHEAELQEFKSTKENEKTEISGNGAATAVKLEGENQEALDVEDGESKQEAPKMSKAKRKRERKALKAKQQAELSSKAEAEYIYSERYKEEEKIGQILKNLSLEVKPMISDGNCLYYAIEDQLKSREIEHDSAELRLLTSQYMLNNRDEFLPFLTKLDSDECYSGEEFEKYCQDIAETSAWGGQVELRALSHVLQTPIHVIQADMPTVKIGEEYNHPPVLLTYHRHEFGLGEHYNSVQPYKEDKEEQS